MSLLQQLNTWSCVTMLQVIFDELPTVEERMSDLTSLSGQISATLDVNDQTTLKETVGDINSRWTMITGAASRRQKSLCDSITMWNDFQVCTSHY